MSIDIKALLRQSERYHLKVTLKVDKIKGVGLYAVTNIKKDDKIAYYKLRIYDARTYQSPTDFVYTFTVFTRSGRPIPELIGDVDQNSFPRPENGLPFWGPFVNEPSTSQQINAGFNPNLKYNYKLCHKCGPKKGDTVIYTLYALKDIARGAEILVYYGDEYTRDYDISEHHWVC
jgi:hypothetical protein